MGQGRSRGQVTDCEHRVGCPALRIHHDEAVFVDGRACYGDADGVAVGPPAHHHGDRVGREDGLTTGARHPQAIVLDAKSLVAAAEAHA